LYLISFSFAVTVAPLLAVPGRRADEIAVLLAAPIVALLVVPRLVRAALGHTESLAVRMPKSGVTLSWDEAVMSTMGIAGIVVQGALALRSYWRFNFGSEAFWLAFGSYVLLLAVVIFVLQATLLRRHT
jgi:hypothetical protein